MRDEVVARKYGMVLDHSLFVEYWKFRRGEGYNEPLVQKILTYFHNEFLTNVGQFEHNKVQIDRRFKYDLAKNGFISQSLQELAALTTYKIILRISVFFFIKGIITAAASISILYCLGTAIR